MLGEIWKGDILIAEIEDLEKLDASEIYPRRLNPKEVIITHKDGELVFLVADGSAKLSERERLRVPRNHSETGIHRKERESQGDGEEFQLDEELFKDFSVCSRRLN